MAKRMKPENLKHYSLFIKDVGKSLRKAGKKASAIPIYHEIKKILNLPADYDRSYGVYLRKILGRNI